MNKQRKFILIAAVVGIIGTFLPWVSVSAGAFGFSMSQSSNGFHGLGIFYFLLLIAVAVIVNLGNKQETLEKNHRLAVIGAGAVAFLSIFIAYSSIKNDVGGGYGMVSASMGVGLILSFAASIAVVLIPIFIKKAGESLSGDFSNLTANIKTMQTEIKLPKASAPRTPNRMEELEKLINWREQGKITAEEYEDLKSKII